MRHVIIMPARNESGHIEKTIHSLLSQTSPADRIYVVDDGSSDDTADLVQEISKADGSVVLLRKKDRGSRLMGKGVIHAFNYAYEYCAEERFTYISKIDSDLEFPPDYFEQLLDFMDERPHVAAASGIMYDRIDGKLVRLRLPENHVPGALKTFRKSVFDEMGGFIPVLSWDIIDLVKARSLGYVTAQVGDLVVVHQRQHASAEGLLKGKAQWGTGAYVIGSHPLFVLCRGLYRMLEPPYITGGMAFWYGYLNAVITGTDRVTDEALIRCLRKEQLYRLFHFNRLPKPGITA